MTVSHQCTTVIVQMFRRRRPDQDHQPMKLGASVEPRCHPTVFDELEIFQVHGTTILEGWRRCKVTSKITQLISIKISIRKVFCG